MKSRKTYNPGGTGDHTRNSAGYWKTKAFLDKPLAAGNRIGRSVHVGQLLPSVLRGLAGNTVEGAK